MIRELVLGGPGTGKTHTLVERVRAALAAGARPDQVAFTSFTKAAVSEARSRVATSLGIDERELTCFRTLHSLAFQELGLRRSDVVTELQLAEFGDRIGETFGNQRDEDEPLVGAEKTTGHELLVVDQYARATRRPLEAAWRELGEEVDFHRLDRFSRAYEAFKREAGLIDFTGMMERYLAQRPLPIPVKLAIIDEVQDLTPLQWQIVMTAYSEVETLIAGGDDDQAVHRWAGADPELMLSLDWPRTHLVESKRLPRAIHALAQEVVRRITNRFDKPTVPSNRLGSVDWYADPNDVDLTTGSWLLLARTRYQLVELCRVCRQQGVVYEHRGRSSVDPADVRAMKAYEDLRKGDAVTGDLASLVLFALEQNVAQTLPDARLFTAADLTKDYGARFDRPWHQALTGIKFDDREYYLACRRRGEKLLESPRVRVETLHGAKGSQADRVLLMTDTTVRVERGYELDPDAEHRVFYVGITRAREQLHIVEPRGPNHYVI